MPPPISTDDNLVFMYKCLQHASGKVDFQALAVELGTSVGAARMRFVRIKAKIENPGATGTVATSQPAQTSPPQVAKKGANKTKATVPRKRKADDVTSSGDSPAAADPQAPPQVDGPYDTTAITLKRSTRGKKHDSIVSSDSDYVCKVEDKDNSLAEAEDGVEPVTKRLKIGSPSSAGVRSSSTPQPQTTRKNKKRQPAGRVQSKVTIASKVKANARNVPSDLPLPSVEHSPLLVPSNAFTVHANIVAAPENLTEIDLKRSLRPGTLISIPPKHPAQTYADHPNAAFDKSSSISGPTISLITPVGPSFASHDQQNEDVYAWTLRPEELRPEELRPEELRPEELRPEDSVSNVSANRRPFVAPPVTYAAVQAAMAQQMSTVEYFMGLFTPWGTG